MGGGVFAYTHKKYNTEHIVNSDLSCPDLEIQWLCQHLRDTRKTFMTNVYRPPDGNITNALELIENNVIDILSTGNPDIIILLLIVIIIIIIIIKSFIKCSLLSPEQPQRCCTNS